MLNFLKKLKKRGKHPEKDPNEIRKFPPEVMELLGKAGLDTDTLLFGVTGDMELDGTYGTVWLSLDEKGIYYAVGNEEVKKVKGKRHLKTEYSLDSLVCTPFEDYDKLKTERYLTTARLIAEKDGEDIAVAAFSVGLIGRFESFAGTFNALKEGKPAEEAVKAPPPPGKCPKCGAPLPPGNRPCPKCVNKVSTFMRLLTFFSEFKWKVVLIVVSMLISTAISLLIPQISSTYLYDNVLNTAGTQPYEVLLGSLGGVVLAIIAIKVVNLLFTVVYQYVVAGILPWIIYDIKLKIFEAMQRLSVGFYSAKQTGSLIERVNRDSNNIYWFFVDGMPYLIISMVTVVGVVAIMFATSVKLTLMVLASIPVVGLIYFFSEKLFRRLHHKNWVSNSNLTSAVSDNINGHRIIKAFSKEDEEFDRFREKSGKVMSSELSYANAEATVFPIIGFIVSVAFALLMAFGGKMVVDGELTLGKLMSFVVYANMLQSPISFLSWVSNWWARCADSAQRVFEIIDSKPDVFDKENPVIIENVRGEIELNELEFEYEPARPVIKKLDLKIAAGEMLGIVGKTGAGKTTIANLIARLYDAKAGCVKIDGYDVKELKMEQLRTNIGIVSQDIYLFIGTIADNIRYANPEADFSMVVAAAKAASAHDFIMKLPDGYETRVGSGGQDLSGGERQRISIARTIIQNPKILILDEATAAMDTETERNIQTSLSRLKKGRTTIAIAHRLSTLRDADHLAVIDSGKVIEYGTFDELIRSKGEYFKLYQIQSEALKYIGIGE
ncbi:MAG: ABC transporter ATP-binding protein [Clostridiales bacterium]|nr:ABC transporter ATP-binding protein [Clostridiales bacterium]